MGSSSHHPQPSDLLLSSQNEAPEPPSPSVNKDLNRGRSAPRSKKGCWTCRERKVKCDETRPECNRCLQAHRECTYIIPTGRRKRVYASQQGQDLPEQHQEPQPPQRRDTGEPLTPATATPISRESPSTALPLRPHSRSDTTRSSTPRDHNAAAPSSASSPATGPASHDENDILSFYKEQYLLNLSTKNPQWSFFSGVINLGQADSALMNILMANARLDYRGDGDELVGLKHYTSGIRDLAGAFSTGRFDPLSLVMTMFMLIQFELRHAEKAEHIRSHLRGLTAMLTTHMSHIIPAMKRYDGTQRPPLESLQFGVQQEMKPEPPTPTQLTYGSRDYSQDVLVRYQGVLNKIALYINYFDSAASSWDLDGGVMDFFTCRYPGALDHLVSESEQALEELWGDAYPASEANDDLINKPVWELFHDSNVLRYRVTLFRRALISDPPTASRLHAEISAEFDRLNARHADFIRGAPLWPQTDETPPRMVTNLRFVVPYHHAAQVDFHRAAGSITAAQRHALAIIQCAALVHETETTASLSRLAWPMFLAGTETTDAAHQGWLLERMKEVGAVGISFKRGYLLLKGVVKRRRRTGEWVDYRRWLLEGRGFERFIL